MAVPNPVAFALGLALFAASALAGPTGARAQQDGALVRVDRVVSQPISQTVPVLGRLVPRQAGVVSARVDASVAAIRVEVGDRVVTGQVIALLDAARLEARRNLAASEVGEAQARLATSKAELGLARQALKRMEGLKKSAAFSQARYDDAHQNVVIAKAHVSETRAAVGSARADLELAEINLSDTEIRAPYDGVVSQRLTETGAYVRVGDPLVRLIADGSLEIEADVPFQWLSGLFPGTAVAISLDDGSNHTATVRALVPEENPLTRTRAVRFVPTFDGTERPLAANQSVTVYVPQGAPRTVLTVHKDAVIKRGEEALVFVAKGDVAEARQITLGEAVGGRYEVLAGLREGELVVVRGNERLQTGDKVVIDGAS